MDSPEILAFFMGRKLNRALVRKLKITMIIVNGLIDQAEEKQIVMRSEKKWLDELKDAAYEADDLFDEIAYEALRSKLNAGSVARKVSKLFSSHNSFENAMNAKLEEILELLECLLRQMNALGLNLKDDLGDEPSSHKTPTTSVIPYGHFGIYGREHDRQNIIRSLLSNDSNGVSAICIVGISGVGKTSLAQHVYYDKQVDRHFDLKAWVYVSEEFNVFKITTDIYNQVSSEDIYMVKGSKELQLELKQKLEGKKFLLVLDDVWSDELTEWESLLEPWRLGDKEVRLLLQLTRKA
ncbi:hypothetical protein GH714_017207 [Hevea brasiliensis]|uniref:NB-ARC domain-containing protein n=1 Tax=Hevea brasiliensis TaxID=3981 RepID=A0A6A6N8F2_HEVBR|nr:hypothetical protein GH714_017207 [Hevea brasiliensis]